MSRRHKDLGSGPPRGPGHYSDDGRWWWEDRLGRWFPVTDQEDELEVETENYAETSLFNRLWSGFFTYWDPPRTSGSSVGPAAPTTLADLSGGRGDLPRS